MTMRFEVRSVLARLTCAALVLGLFASAPAATHATVVSSADLSYDRARDRGLTFWRSSLAIVSPAAAHGLVSAEPRLPAALVLADRGARAASGAAIPRGDQLALEVRYGSSRGHGTLAELCADWRRYGGSERGGRWLSLGASGVAGDEAALCAPLLGMGGWMRWQRFSLIAQVDQTPGHRGGRDARSTTWAEMTPESLWIYHTSTEPAVPGELATVTRMQVSAAYEHRGFALEAASGLNVERGLPARRWARGSVTVAVLPPISMFASYGGSPEALFVEESPGRPRAAVGMRLTPAPRVTVATPSIEPGDIESWRLRRVGEGLYRFTLRVTGATTVELMGDMTDWQPVGFERTGPSRWEATLAMEPGVHQIVARVDGRAWAVPPRMTSTESEFADRVGVLVVE